MRLHQLDEHASQLNDAPEVSVTEAGGYYTQPVYDMIEKHGYEKVMRELLASLHADVIQDFIRRTDLNEAVVIEATNDAYAALAKTAYPNAQTIVKIAKAMDRIGMNGGGWLRGVIPEKGDKYSFIWDGQSQPSGITKMGRPRNLPRDGGNPGGTTKSIPTNKPQPGLPKTTEV